MEKNFKKGQWLIRRWSKENGGETDFAKFEEPYNSDEFTHTKFYRFKDNKLMWTQPKSGDKQVEYTDGRMSLNWRIATKAEITKYAFLVFCA